jgi:PPOX class probable F420-dependent enzyme
MWTTNNLKTKITTAISSKVHLDKHIDNNNENNNTNVNNSYSTIIEKYSCWCILFVNNIKIDARIIHKGRGRFKIVEDKYKGKYVNRMVDASDIINCKVTSSPSSDHSQLISSNSNDNHPHNKQVQFPNQKQYINLETYKMSGEAVQTPMWFINYNGIIYVSTARDSAKVKRLRNNSHVRIVPCNFIGHPNGEWVEAEAYIVNSNQSEKANKLLKQKYDLQQQTTTFPDSTEEIVISICI